MVSAKGDWGYLNGKQTLAILLGTNSVDAGYVVVPDREEPPKKPAVLIVEDEPLIRMTAADYVAEAGWQPLEAATAREARVVLGEHAEVKVLFTDVNMPGGMNGLELTEIVHRDYPEVELVVTSGKHRISEDSLPDNGSFLPKPYLEADLLRVLREKID